MTALHCAVANKHIDTATFLLQQGSDIAIADSVSAQIKEESLIETNSHIIVLFFIVLLLL